MSLSEIPIQAYNRIQNCEDELQAHFDYTEALVCKREEDKYHDFAENQNYLKNMELKAKLLRHFDGKTLDLKTAGILAKLNQRQNNCWLTATSYLILNRNESIIYIS